MKILKKISLALVALFVVCSVFTACDKDALDMGYIEDIAGTWTSLENGCASALVINEDGSFVTIDIDENLISSGDLKGFVEVDEDDITFTFDNGNNFSKNYEMVAGEKLTLIDTKSGKRVNYNYCDEDFSEKIQGCWLYNWALMGAENEISIWNFNADGSLVYSGYNRGTESYGYGVSSESSYRLVGDLLIIIDSTSSGQFFTPMRIGNTPDTTELILHASMKFGSDVYDTEISLIRQNETLNLKGLKFDYRKNYVNNVKGLDKEYEIMGHTYNFAKSDISDLFEEMLKSIHFTFEFPTANTLRYSYSYNNENKEVEVPVDVDGSIITIKMSERGSYYRDLEFYNIQNASNNLLRMYMSTNAFIDLFTNMLISEMERKGTLESFDAAAVEALHKSVEESIESILICFNMVNA